MAGARGRTEATWHRAKPAPLVLVSGPQEVFGARAIDRIRHAVADGGPAVEATRLDAAAYTPGALMVAASPSLFDDASLVVCESCEQMNDAFLADALAYAEAPMDDVVIVLRHGGGVRGKKLLDTLRKAGVPEYTCPAVTRDADVVDFVAGEFERGKRPIQASVVRAIVDAVGSDVAELAAAASQLMSDVDGSISLEHVQRYYGTRVNATGFAVADAAVVGDVAGALTKARHALESGIDPVPLNAALASRIRTLVKVGAARGRGIDDKALDMAPWQVDRARKDLRHWNAQSLALAIEVVAQADADIKGASRSPGFALERAVREVATLAAG